MASEYLKWKYRDVQPDIPVTLTNAQKRANWWHYHKWQVVIGVVLILAVLDIGRHALHIGEIQPDYQMAYVGAAPLPTDTAAALEKAVAALGTDCNGDGRVVVQLNQYATAEETDSAEGLLRDRLREQMALPTSDSDSADRAYFSQAARVGLMADLERCDSYFFILEDGETFQGNYQVLSHTDGTLPAENEAASDSCWLHWTDCPVLLGLELGEYTDTVAGEAFSGDSQSLFADLCFARRGFWMEQTCKYPEECEALWNRLTEGAAT